ncbi:MAG TPA: ACT domain-containing protein, partial [Ilumatobacter sp.]|nr:ACT domain-containing protein [Ilumatobacter sp.]
ARLFRDGGDHDQLPTTMFSPRGRHKSGDDSIGVHVEGLDDLMVRLASCCTPLPGDEIIGFVTRGRGVSVHRHDCANAASLGQEQAMRMIEVDWDDQRRDQLLRAGVEVVALDRSRLLLDIANALGDQGVNIVSCDTSTGDDRVAKLRFQIEMSNPAQLVSVMNHVKRVEGVFDVYRIVPGAPATE